MLLPLLMVPFITLLCILIDLVYFKFGGRAARLYKIVALIALYFNLFYSAWLWSTFPRISSGAFEIVYPAACKLNSGFLFEAGASLSLPFILLSTFIVIVGLLTAWYSSANSNVLTILLLMVELCLIGAFSCTNLFVFLLFFELSALPIFVLIAYCGSPRRERVKAGYYFLVFTLYGSIALLLVLLSSYGFAQVNFVAQGTSANSSFWLLLFIAFAVKVPLFPFHTWLPYAHVEASTTASIILAALLLKLGGYGVLRFLIPMFSVDTQSFFQPAALFICLAGVIYGGLCALRQIDMKRQIAFSSISHMSFALLGVFTYSEVGIKGGLYLMVSHGLTSAALFFLVGVLSDRYHTRSVFAYSGLLAAMPIFIFFLLLVSLANAGFPGTSGFIPEFFILIGVISTSLYLVLPALLGMFLTAASGLLLVMRIAYGHLRVSSSLHFADLTKLEGFVLSILSLFIIWLGISDPWGAFLATGAFIMRRKVVQVTTGFVLLALFGLAVGATVFWGAFLSIGPEILLLCGIFWLLISLNTKSTPSTFALLGVDMSIGLICFAGFQAVYFTLVGLVDVNKLFLVLVLGISCLWFILSWVFVQTRNITWYIAVIIIACGWWFSFMYYGVGDFSKFGYLVNGSTQLWKFVLFFLYLVVFVLIGTFTHFRGIGGERASLQEYCVIFWLILAFSIMLVSITNLVVFLIVLEGVSLASYVLPVLGRTRGGVVAAVKYFIFGTLGSIYFLWGVINLYAVWPGLDINSIAASEHIIINLPAKAVQLMLIGILIKLGAAPAHQWVPDVYSGAPLSVTFLFATFIKVFLFILFWRFAVLFTSSGEVELAAGLSIAVGCYYTLRQKEIKRFLAYSSVTHTGFLLLGDIVTAGLYLFIYIFSVVLFFSVLFEYKLAAQDSLVPTNNDLLYLTDLRYLNLQVRPRYAVLTIISLVTMAGLPPLGGFFMKFWLLNNLVEDIALYNDLTSFVLFIVVLIASIISMFYYLRLIVYILIGSESFKRRWLLASGILEYSKALRVAFISFKAVQLTIAVFLVASVFWVPLTVGIISVFVAPYFM